MNGRVPERRCSARYKRPEEHGIVALRIRPGHQALVMDVSDEGVQIETGYRLLPGTAVDLLVETSTNKTTVRGQVLRSSVSCVRPSSVSYRGAIGFERALAWYGGAGSACARVDGGEQRAGMAFRADATPQVV